VGQVGLSEVGADTIRRAHAVHPVADVQLEYSLISRGIEEKVLPAVRELGIGVTAYGVLSRGLLSGHWSTERPLRGGDLRTHGPRFQPGNVERNLALVEALRAVAVGRGATVAQVAIAWVLARGREIVPVIGARRPDRLAEALGALDLALTGADLAAIERAVPPGSAAGDRYPAPQMAHLDSEG
jgi:aryl-alcohol dehydrogenase-like predicted oxidoreductase